MLVRLRPLAVGLVLTTALAVAGEPVDLDAVTRIREEGFRRSQVMETLRVLTDEIGPRLTGSPQMKEANEWTRDKLAEWGLENAALESYEFGRGWSFSRVSVHMTAPRAMPLIALPKAWTPGTKKTVRGPVMRVDLDSEQDLEKHAGKLKGKILLLDDAADVSDGDSPELQRYDDVDLERIESFRIPGDRRRGGRSRWLKRWEFAKKRNAFLVEEKVLATIDASSRDGGKVRLGSGGSYTPGESAGVPALTMTIEHYNQLIRLLDHDHEVELEIEVDATFHDDDTLAYNTVAELPGTDLADEVVMVGAHLDSWHPGTGAADNASGCAVAMEALRILKAAGLKPRRTIRVGLWSGEEQGLLGSRQYVKRHFATRPEPEDEEQRALPERMRERTWPIQPLAGHETFSAYFNLDNGSGKIRGIYAEENAAARPIFESWLEPLHDLGADTVTLRRTGGTDHTAFNDVGLPGFQFIQDRLDYFSRAHHTNMDLYDRLQPDDMKQASVVMAVFLYHAAQRDELFPRRPMPQKPPEEEKEEEKKEEGD